MVTSHAIHYLRYILSWSFLLANFRFAAKVGKTTLVQMIRLHALGKKPRNQDISWIHLSKKGHHSEWPLHFKRLLPTEPHTYLINRASPEFRQPEETSLQQASWAWNKEIQREWSAWAKTGAVSTSSGFPRLRPDQLTFRFGTKLRVCCNFSNVTYHVRRITIEEPKIIGLSISPFPSGEYDWPARKGPHACNYTMHGSYGSCTLNHSQRQGHLEA